MRMVASAAKGVCAVLQLQIVIGILALAVMALMSWRANRRLRSQATLPMQFFLDGTVTWSAPRRLALMFTPGLAACALAFTIAIGVFLQPRPGQEHLALPVTLFIAALFCAAHALHLWMIGKSLQRE